MKPIELDRLASTWAALGRRQQTILIAGLVGVVLSILLVTRIATRTEFALLYSGLEPSMAGEVVAELEQRGIAHDIRPSGIFVDASQRDRLRLSLASSGLPSTGGSGYELLDNISGFGTTAQMFDVTYLRAKEGELARTIAAGSSVKSARVHISVAAKRGFRSTAPASASVFITPSRGRLTPAQVQALQFLVSSAMAGMQPDEVSVVDSVSGMLLSGGDAEPGAAAEGELAERLRSRVERLLEARVGPGNAVVEVNVTSELERERVIERRFDPESRVAISTETTENSSSSNRDRTGPVTVASNLPDGDATGAGAQDSVAENETRERVNYEVSETTREIERQPGTVKRLTVAVLVNGLGGTGDDGQPVVVPRSDDEIAALEDLVKSAVGYDAARGDVVTIRSMELPQSVYGTERTAPGLLGGVPLNVNALGQTGIVALAAVLLGLLVVRPLLANAPRTRAVAQQPGMGLPAPDRGERQVADPGANLPQAIPAAAQTRALEGEIAGPGDPLPTIEGSDRLPNKADAVLRLREQMKLRKADSVAVLQSWVEDAGEVR